MLTTLCSQKFAKMRFNQVTILLNTRHTVGRFSSIMDSIQGFFTLYYYVSQYVIGYIVFSVFSAEKSL